ncbi:MAG: phenylacetate--CoA ligase family protein [Thermoplasmatales archaeon]|nr:MAG: phenylacetate--CoA ligase family protein [Thermoplasmatales archaeon]
MSLLFKPLILSRVLKSYLVDPNRLRRSTNEELKAFQNNQLRKMVFYAYKVPLYRDKYKTIGIHPKDIHGIDDIEKLPFITKDDIRKYSPDGIISSSFNKKDGIVSRTGGTTGKSLPVFFDLYTVIKGMLGFVRALNEYGIDWRKTKMSLLIDLSERSFENEYFINSIFSAIKPLFSEKNIQIFDLFSISEKVIKKIDQFQPEFIGGYPFALIRLAMLKERGLGKNIAPRCILSSGSYFDEYSKKLIEEKLDSKIYDFYAATESGPIAFECKKGYYHVHSDLIYPEFITNGNPVSPGKPGTLVITKLYGKGTPIIRYTGIDDIVTIPKNKCSCGLSGTLIKKIHGRKSHSILLPNGIMVLPSFMDDILGLIIYKTKVNKIQRIQIIQHKINSLEIKVLFNKELRDMGTPPEKIFNVLKRIFLEKSGSEIKLKINEVKHFDAKDQYFISRIDRTKFIERKYLI